MEPGINQIDPLAMLAQYNQDLKVMQEEVLGLYFDLVIFQMILFMLNAHKAWDATLNIPLIVLLALSLLVVYVHLKQVNCVFGKLADCADSLFISFFCLCLVLYYNALIDSILEISIVIFVEDIFILLLKVKNFLLDQPFFKFYLLTRMQHWVTRQIIHLALIMLADHSKGWENNIVTLVGIYFYLMLTMSAFVLFSMVQDCFIQAQRNELVIQIRGQLLLLMVSFGLGYTSLIVAQGYSNEISAEQNVYFISIYHFIEISLLLSAYPTVMCVDFFKTCHQRYDRIQEILQNLPVVANQTMPSFAPPICTHSQQLNQERIREYQAQGILKVALERVSSTLFRIVKLDSSPASPARIATTTLESQAQNIQSLGNEEQPIAPRSVRHPLKIVPLQTIVQEDSQHLKENSKRTPREGDQISPKSEQNDKCIVCFDNIPNTVFHPCGHGGLCYDCAKLIFNKQQGCSLCRQPIRTILKYTLEHGAQTTYQIVSLSTVPRRSTILNAIQP